MLKTHSTNPQTHTPKTEYFRELIPRYGRPRILALETPVGELAVSVDGHHFESRDVHCVSRGRVSTVPSCTFDVRDPRESSHRLVRHLHTVTFGDAVFVQTPAPEEVVFEAA